MSAAAGFRRLSEIPVHQGHVWHVAVAEFSAPDGTLFRRDIVRSPGAVGIVPLLFDPGPSVVLVSQYRPPYDMTVVEIPAGMRDVEGEDTMAVARRELQEEVGLAAGDLHRLGEIYPSPGMTDSVTTLYLATGCTAVTADRQGPEEEHMEILHVPFTEALDMVDRGEIRDAKSVAGLLLAERHLRHHGPGAGTSGPG